MVEHRSHNPEVLGSIPKSLTAQKGTEIREAGGFPANSAKPAATAKGEAEAASDGRALRWGRYRLAATPLAQAPAERRLRMAFWTQPNAGGEAERLKSQPACPPWEAASNLFT